MSEVWHLIQRFHVGGESSLPLATQCHNSTSSSSSVSYRAKFKEMLCHTQRPCRFHRTATMHTRGGTLDRHTQSTWACQCPYQCYLVLWPTPYPLLSSPSPLSVPSSPNNPQPPVQLDCIWWRSTSSHSADQLVSGWCAHPPLCAV